MKVITGGAYQGKTQYAISKLGIKECDIVSFGDGKRLSDICDSDIKCISGLHLFIRDCIFNDADPDPLIERITGINPDIVIICDEVGSGIIPLDKKENLYRETVGRIMCRLSGKADEVIRVVCGIGMKIK